VVGISRLINNEKLIINNWRRIPRTAVVFSGEWEAGRWKFCDVYEELPISFNF
jgi:hypothetical protein